MKLKLAVYLTAAAMTFLATIALLTAVTDRRVTPNPWPTVCTADGLCAYVTATPRPTWQPATATAWANYQLAVYATNEAATNDEEDAPAEQ
jgi:hypothetical protein